MPVGIEPISPLLALALLGLIGALFVWMFRGAQIPGGRPAGAIVAGLVAGILLGPAVLGKWRPDAHRMLFVGGVAEARALEDMRREQFAEAKAALAGGLQGEALGLQRAEMDRRVRPALGALAEAEAQHAQRERTQAGLFLVVVLVLAAAAGASARRRTGAWRERARASVPHAVGLAGVAFLGPVIVAAAAGRFVFNLSALEALAVGATAGCGSLLAGARLRRELVTGADARLATMKGASALAGAAGVVVVGAMTRDPLLTGLAVGAVVLGWASGVAVARSSAAHLVLLGLLLWIGIPVATGWAAAQVDPAVVARSGWMGLLGAVLLLVACGDARWFSVAAGSVDDTRASADGHGGRWDQASAWMLTAPGTLQAVLAAALIATGTLDPARPAHGAVLAALLLGAAVIEVFTRAYGVAATLISQKARDGEQPGE